jgi:hypothetical protein
MGRDKIRVIFGGGAKGEKALKMFDDLIEVKKAVDSVPSTDPAKFIQRSFYRSSFRYRKYFKTYIGS